MVATVSSFSPTQRMRQILLVGSLWLALFSNNNSHGVLVVKAWTTRSTTPKSRHSGSRVDRMTMSILRSSCPNSDCNDNYTSMIDATKLPSRRSFGSTVASSFFGTMASTFLTPHTVWADDAISPVELSAVSPDARKLFNEGRALELQGNMAAAQRVYTKVTLISPRFVYGWSSLGNAQTAFGDLDTADRSYTTAVGLCRENLDALDRGIAQPKRCNDLSLLLLNRGSLRLNNRQADLALVDLQQAMTLQNNRPDALLLQNLARAEELNGLYKAADTDYTKAIALTANEVNPFWLRACLCKYQLGDVSGGYDLLQRVNNRFPQAPEVRAAVAVFLLTKGDATAAQQKFLEIPDRPRMKYVDRDYLENVIAWPSTMREALGKITVAVGDGPAK